MEPIILKRLGIASTLSVLLVTSWSGASGDPVLIGTIAHGEPTDPSWACSASGADLMWAMPEGGERVLSSDFVVACDPALDPHGRTLYFSGRRSPGESFRIWQLDLVTREIAPLTPDGLEPRRPFALPQGSVAFASQGDLFRWIAEDGSIEQLTFTGGRLRSAELLADGRILFLHRSHRGGRLFSMLPDGTWSTLWPGLSDISVRDFSILGSDRLLVLGDDGALLQVSISDPFAPRREIPFDTGDVVTRLQRGGDGSALLLVDKGGKSGELSTRAMSLRFEPELRWADLGRFGSRTLLSLESAGPALAADPLPSIVKPEEETGYLFVIDVARTDDPSLADLDRSRIGELRIYSLDRSGSRSLLLAAEPATDGSVYVEAPADTPLALEMVDRQGGVLAATETAIWVRPNERRGCIGCHVSPAYAPPNIRPEALLREPYRVQSGSEESP